MRSPLILRFLLFLKLDATEYVYVQGSQLSPQVHQHQYTIFGLKKDLYIFIEAPQNGWRQLFEKFVEEKVYL